MSIALTRMFAYFTLGLYLIVGAIFIRFTFNQDSNLEIPLTALEFFRPTILNSDRDLSLDVPTLGFRPIEETRKKVIYKKMQLVASSSDKSENLVGITSYELFFEESVTLKPIYMKKVELVNVATLYQDFSFTEPVIVEGGLTDEVTTKQASVKDELNFFDYEVQNEGKKEQTANNLILNDDQEEKSTIQDDQKKSGVVINQIDEDIKVSDLIAFDYSSAKKDMLNQQIPKVSGVSSHQVGGQFFSIDNRAIETKKQSLPEKVGKKVDESKSKIEKASFVAPLEDSKRYSSLLTIQASGTDLKGTQEIIGFEVRPQDDLNEAISDHNGGIIRIEEALSQETMTRSVSILKRGFAPTNTDLIFEEGSAEVTYPLIDETVFNELLKPYDSMGPQGMVLVELGNAGERTSLDVPYSKVLYLDENMVVTSDKNYVYQLYVGVKAGNALLSYHKKQERIISKIIHIHDHEVTYDSNIYGPELGRSFSLVEEDLLGKEKMPLIVTSENVREFATERTAKKINDHTYKLETHAELLGARRYLELTHHSEPVFVGFKNSSRLVIPSENFMRYVLTKTQSPSVANRCLVQVNLTKEVSKIDVGSESVSQSLELETHFLDSDGKLYDSAGPKTEKVIIIGENQGTAANSQDGKVNLKVSYVDGTVEYLSSYCSPNTYLVEQL